MRKSLLFKTVLILVFAVVAFHAVGAEMAFCDDGYYGQATDHGCQMCQPGHHAVTSTTPAFVSGISLPVSFVVMDLHQIHLENPSFTFFRPPISR